MLLPSESIPFAMQKDSFYISCAMPADIRLT